MSAFWSRCIDALDQFWDAFFGPPPTRLERATSENLRLKAMLRTRELEAENAKLREDLGL